VDLAVIFRLHSKQQVEACSEAFLGHWEKKVGVELMESYIWKDDETEQRQCLVLDQSNNVPIDQSLFACQPVEVPDFILGAYDFWLPQEPFLRPRASATNPTIENPNPLPIPKNTIYLQ